MKLLWDQIGTRTFETGVSKGALYLQKPDGTYPEGVSWSGLTGITKNPSGAEATPIYADNIKFLNLVSNEEFAITIEAYMYPDEWAVCNGEVSVVPGMYAGQQTRASFGLAYMSILGNDTEGYDHGEVLHIVYGGLAAPSSVAHTTISDSQDPATLSWEVSTTPVISDIEVDGKKLKALASLDIYSTKTDPVKWAALLDIIYGKDPTTEGGSDGIIPRLPLPKEIMTLLTVTP